VTDVNVCIVTGVDYRSARVGFERGRRLIVTSSKAPPERAVFAVGMIILRRAGLQRRAPTRCCCVCLVDVIPYNRLRSSTKHRFCRLGSVPSRNRLPLELHVPWPDCGPRSARLERQDLAVRCRPCGLAIFRCRQWFLEAYMVVLRCSGYRTTAAAVVSGILNLVCPDCGGSMGGHGKEFKCQGRCQTDWRQVWERIRSVR
jgi:hypothetical protein